MSPSLLSIPKKPYVKITCQEKEIEERGRDGRMSAGGREGRREEKREGGRAVRSTLSSPPCSYPILKTPMPKSSVMCVRNLSYSLHNKKTSDILGAVAGNHSGRLSFGKKKKMQFK